MMAAANATVPGRFVTVMRSSVPSGPLAYHLLVAVVGKIDEGGRELHERFDGVVDLPDVAALQRRQELERDERPVRCCQYLFYFHCAVFACRSVRAQVQGYSPETAAGFRILLSWRSLSERFPYLIVSGVVSIF